MARVKKKNRGASSKKIPAIFSREVAGIILFSLTLFLVLALFSHPPEASVLEQLFPFTENLAGEAGTFAAGVLYTYLGWSSIWIPLGSAVLGLHLLLRKPLFLWQRLLSLTVLMFSTSIMLAKGAPFPSLDELLAVRGYGGWLGRWGEPLLYEMLGGLGSWVVLLTVWLVAFLSFFKISLKGSFSWIIPREQGTGKQSTNKTASKETIKITTPKASGETSAAQTSILHTEPVAKDPEQTDAAAVVEIKTTSAGYQQPADIELPPLSMLQPPKTDEGEKTFRQTEELGRNLEKALAGFGVMGKVCTHHQGPVITTFEFDPRKGVKASNVNDLAEDLAREINVPTLRVVGKVPGKSLIGIEVPNPLPKTVCLREILESEIFSGQNRILAAALGLDTTGSAVITDLAKLPHLLVAGTTGSGKSVAVNAMICSILFSQQPGQVRMLMVDPKMLELSAYQGIPHLLAPVVTDMRLAAELLMWTVAEMEERYHLMSGMSVKNLGSFNTRIAGMLKKGKKPTRRWIGPQEWIMNKEDRQKKYIVPLEQQPMILVIIDEFADLMIQAGKEVEHAVTRLGQLARAAGIHLIMVTQRPSVDVVTGVIKANFPSRLAFQVASKVDSRTILDKNGAETLLGRGDGLFKAPGTSKLQRVHAPFVSDDELNKLVNYLRKQKCV